MRRESALYIFIVPCTRLRLVKTHFIDRRLYKIIYNIRAHNHNLLARSHAYLRERSFNNSSRDPSKEQCFIALDKCSSAAAAAAAVLSSEKEWES